MHHFELVDHTPYSQNWHSTIFFLDPLNLGPRKKSLSARTGELRRQRYSSIEEVIAYENDFFL